MNKGTVAMLERWSRFVGPEIKLYELAAYAGGHESVTAEYLLPLIENILCDLEVINMQEKRERRNADV